MDVNQVDEQSHFHITYGFSPKHYVEVKHTKVTKKDLQKIAEILGIKWFEDNEGFKGKLAEDILKKAANECQLLMAIEAKAPEKFNLFEVTDRQQAEIQEILSTYPETFKVSTSSQIILG